MDKEQARNLIKETFENQFNKARYTAFIKNLLNRIEEAPFTYQGQYIPDAYKPYISTLERIGKYSDAEHKIDILIIRLKKETSLERARTMQRNFVAWYLNGSRGGDLKDAALVAFIAPDETDWRFSLVKMDYKFEQGPTGKTKVKQEFTPARRWSFLVGVNEKSHTAQSRLVPILSDDVRNPSLAQLEEAFNIETVTKEFFLKYRELFVRTKEALDKVVEGDPRVKADFETKGVDTVNFAKKLLGQIVFLYFLQKKGWFGVERDAEWGTGSRQFLRELFERKHGSYKNFFNDILEPLFYEALRNDRSHDDDYYSRFNCKIPFLNGGLFDPIGNYDWVHTDIHLPNGLFSNDSRTKEGDIGDGILDIFDRYNFTVREDEPLEKEVAIDPELLGKAYEKFNAIRPDNFEEYKKALKSGKKGDETKFNKHFGVYYTPREIVHYMCQQSLINYMAKVMEGNISKEDIETLIHLGEQVGENEEIALIKEQKILEGKQKSSDYKLKLPENIRNNAGLIDQKLVDITVCDPAVGSGAFPVGMMSEIVRARNVLSTLFKDGNQKPYDFKRQCIEHSLYGVDIDPGAVEIAKLRLWLSLVVDEDQIEQIKPLPNLDYKIVCGNSLVGFPDSWNSPIVKEIEALKHAFFNETNPKKKSELKGFIDEKINFRYKNSKKTFGYQVNFDFQTAFSEVFHKKGGFDIAIANPPYVEFKNLSVEIKNTLKDYDTTRGKYDLYIPFIEKTKHLLSKTGLGIFICPTRFVKRDYGKSLRYFVSRNFDFIEYVDFSDLQVFDSAMNYTGIFIFATKDNRATFKYKKVKSLKHISERTLQYILSCSQSNEYVEIMILPNDLLSSEEWHFHNRINSLLMSRIQRNTIPLCELCEGIFQGIATGKDSVFIIDQDIIEKFKLEKELVYPILKGKDIQKYYINWSHKYLIYPYDEYGRVYSEKKMSNDYKHCFAYLISKKKDLAGRSYFEGSNKNWYELWNQRNLLRFLQRKIITLDNARKNTFALDSGIYVGTTTTYSLIMKNKNLDNYLFVLGILNSSLLDYYHKQRTIPQAGGFYRYQALFINSLPIKVVSDPEQKPIANLVNKILGITKDGDYLTNSSKLAKVKEFERQIDLMVYELYGLTGAEIRMVMGNLGKEYA